MLLLDLYHSCKMQLIRTLESKARFVCHRWYIQTCSRIGVPAIFSGGFGWGVGGRGESLPKKLSQVAQTFTKQSSTNGGYRIH